MICKNCNQNFDGNFCNNCGQKFNTQRINFRYLIAEIFNNILQVNRGIFFTIKELSIRPGHSIREFLLGKRKQHFKPLAFIILTATVFILINYFIDKEISVGEGFFGAKIEFTDDKNEVPVTTNIMLWISRNFAYSTLILLPFFSFASYICFIREKYNFFEHLILNSYIAGQRFMIHLTFTIIAFIFKIEGSFTQDIIALFPILYTIWVFIQFFKNKKMFLKILLTIATYLLSYILTVSVLYSMATIEEIIRK